ADDDAAVARGIGRVLTAAGYEVTIVVDGATAVEALTHDSYSVILSDIHMPGLSGVELLSVVRAYDLDVPVVLMTGDPKVETAMKAVELGALNYLLKPMSPVDLRDAVDRAAKLHKLACIKREALHHLGVAEKDAGELATLKASFDRAMATLWVAFQPIVLNRERKVFGYEALLRSAEPLLPHPGAVLDAAERLNRLPELGQRIRALSAAAFENAPADALLFVNLHSRDLLDPMLYKDSEPLSKIAKRVVLEVTERASLDEVKDTQARIALLRYMGYRIAVDDLGAGYAGLTSFAKLEPEFVKLDMSLIRDVHESPTKQKLVRSLAALCKEMGLLVVAEGIEVEAEREFLDRLGCNLMQGYLFAKPNRPFPGVSWG
ncbi:MAG: EAL domain-containing response regulator, partial [Polyangiaceae bacterium]